MRKRRFEGLVRTFLRWRAEGRIRARFNVTDGRIYTLDYIDLPTARKVVGELSPTLWREFSEALARDELAEYFYLNPVVAQGRQKDDGSPDRR